MYYYISGKLACKKELFIVIDVAGVGYKIYMAPAFISQIDWLCVFLFFF